MTVTVLAIGPKSLEDLRPGNERLGNRFLDDACELDCNAPPSWFDRERFDRGRRFFFDYYSSVIMAFLCSLIVGFALPNLSDVLEFTGESTGPTKSRKRYMQTLAHIISWHKDDIFDPTTVGYRSIRTIRSWHDSVRRRLVAKLGTDRQFISQYDLALVQCGFIGSVILHPENIGIPLSAYFDDYLYFWKVVGYVLGIEDCFNVCQLEDLKATINIAGQVEQELVASRLRPASEQYNRLANDLMKGYSEIGPPLMLTTPLMQAFIFPSLGLPIPLLSTYEWLSLQALRAHYSLLLYFPLYRRFFNQVLENALRKLKPKNKAY